MPGLGDNAASLTLGTPGVLQGSYTLILQDAFGQVRETHSVSAGLDYSGVGPEHAYLMKTGRVTYESATDSGVVGRARRMRQVRRHFAGHRERACIFRRAALREEKSRGAILIGCSGRGDKDMPILQNTLLKALP